MNIYVIRLQYGDDAFTYLVEAASVADAELFAERIWGDEADVPDDSEVFLPKWRDAEFPHCASYAGF